jgi:alpha-1,6-mannosyltransferase
VLRLGAQRYTRFILTRADLRLAPSPTQAEQLARFGIEDVHVIVPGVDLNTFSPDRGDPSVRSEFDIPEDALFAIYVGRLDSEKRTHTMLAASRLANETRKTVLMMVGQGPNRESLELAQSEGAPIRVVPYQSSKDALARLLASADLYLTAGPYETFGLSVVEAQACGLPVVGVEAGALIERVPAPLGRLGPVDDAAAMAANLLAVADDRDAMALAARAHVERHFSWSSTFERLFGLYTDGLAPSRR